jgi:parallel beta-helix repeat protein
LISSPDRLRTLLEQSCPSSPDLVEAICTVAVTRDISKLVRSDATLAEETQESVIAELTSLSSSTSYELAQKAVEIWRQSGIVRRSVGADRVDVPTNSLPAASERVVDPTVSSAFQTVADAVQGAPSGCVIRVKSGVYVGSLSLANDISLIADGHIGSVVIVGDGAPAVSIDGGSPSIRGFSIQNAGTSPDHLPGIMVVGGAPIITGCDISSRVGPGIVVVGRHTTPTISDCTIHSCLTHGILFDNESAGTVMSCVIQANASDWPDLAAVHVSGRSHPELNGCNVRHNYGSGIRVTDSASGTFLRCEVSSNLGNGFEVDAAGAPLARECAIDSNSGRGVEASRLGMGNVDTCVITRNTRGGIRIIGGALTVFSGCVIHENGGSGVEASDHGKGLLERCDVRANGQHGLLVVEFGAPSVVETSFHDNRGVGILIANMGEGRLERYASWTNGTGNLVVDPGSKPFLGSRTLSQGQESMVRINSIVRVTSLVVGAALAFVLLFAPIHTSSADWIAGLFVSILFGAGSSFALWAVLSFVTRREADAL